MLFYFVAHALVRAHFTQYDNATMSGSVVATYTCETQGFPPTWLSWRRNGELLIIDDTRYSTMQIVTDHAGSYFDNVLLVYDIMELLGDPVYQCNVSSHFGSVVGDIRESLSGMNIIYACIITSVDVI